MRIRISPLDSKFSKLVRLKAGNKCVVCWKPATQIHHFYGRRYKGLRYDFENCLSLCFGCHRKFHENPEWARDFMLKRLGEQRYQMLRVRSNLIAKPDYKLISLWLKQEEKNAMLEM